MVEERRVLKRLRNNSRQNPGAGSGGGHGSPILAGSGIPQEMQQLKLSYGVPCPDTNNCDIFETNALAATLDDCCDLDPSPGDMIRPKITDIDSKVKSMIKLIEEGPDSFARRAKIYYKKRPELMELVEKFYRAYRALAKRYDHPTGALRQAHRTMSEAFPNHIPMMLAGDTPGHSNYEADPRTPKVLFLIRVIYPRTLQAPLASTKLALFA